MPVSSKDVIIASCHYQYQTILETISRNEAILKETTRTLSKANSKIKHLLNYPCNEQRSQSTDKDKQRIACTSSFKRTKT